MKSKPNMKARKIIAKRLLEIIEKNPGLTQEKLSIMAGGHRTIVGRVISKTHGTQIDTLGNIIDALGMTWAEFFSKD